MAFRALIEARVDVYKDTKTTEEKTAILTEVMQVLRNGRHRFLTEDKTCTRKGGMTGIRNCTWIVCRNGDAVRKKIQARFDHLIRNMAKASSLDWTSPVDVSRVAAGRDGPDLRMAAADVHQPHDIGKSDNEVQKTSSLKDVSAASNMSGPEQKWFDRFDKLKSIIKPDGSIDYSALDDESQKSIRNFVKVQRGSFRKREADQPSSMTDERYKLLVDAKLNFKPLGGSSKCESSKAIPIPFPFSVTLIRHCTAKGDTKPKAKKQKVAEEVEKPNMPVSMPPTLGVGDQSTPMKVDSLDEKKPENLLTAAADGHQPQRHRQVRQRSAEDEEVVDAR